MPRSRYYKSRFGADPGHPGPDLGLGIVVETETRKRVNEGRVLAHKGMTLFLIKPTLSTGV